MDGATNVVDNLPNKSCSHYCLKWTNHKLNISSVFDRLRNSQQFCDITLTSADQKFIKCHRLILCAGSGYLEDILLENPSEHPTIVLSQINHENMKLLVDFMYTGEVSVETDKLGKLLEAANILKIKGLWESDQDHDDTDAETETKSELSDGSIASNESKNEAEKPLQIQPASITGSQKRKRKAVPPPIAAKAFKEEPASPPESILTPKSDCEVTTKLYSPLFGVSNAYFLTAQSNEHTKTIPSIKSVVKPSTDIPQLLAHNQIPPEGAPAAVINEPFMPLLSNENKPASPPVTTPKSKKAQQKGCPPTSLSDSFGSVRKYKQYTEQTLQQALKDIMEGQSINRSSVKYNIPARTLRDWMKRLNIKSVFTHNHSAPPASEKVSSSASVESRNPSTESESSIDEVKLPMVISAFPGMTIPMEVVQRAREASEEEEEIDDDEDNNTAADDDQQ